LEREWILQQLQHSQKELDNKSYQRLLFIKSLLNDLHLKKQNLTKSLNKLGKERSELKEKISDSTIQTIREDMLCITEDQWVLVVECNKPSISLESSMCAVLTLLGHQGVTNWNMVQELLNAENANILQKIQDCGPTAVKHEDCMKAELLSGVMNDNGLDEEEGVNEGSDGEIEKLTQILSGWTNAYIQYITSTQRLIDIQKQLDAEKQELETLLNQIAENEVNQKKIESERPRRKCRLKELEYNMENYKSMFDEDEEKETELVEEKRVETKIEYKQSIKNWITIQADNSDLIAIHPVNPTFNLLSVAPVQKRDAFCPSRQYGVFFITHSGSAIAQSPRWDRNAVHLVYRCDVKHNRWDHCFELDQCDDFKSEDEIQKFTSLIYDEGFGISGRLLVHCQTASQSRLCQFFNREELDILETSLFEDECCRNPATGKMEFNMTLAIFEMLYGSEIIEFVLENYEKKRAVLMQKMIEQEQEHEPGKGDGDIDDVDMDIVDDEEGDGSSFEILDPSPDNGIGHVMHDDDDGNVIVGAEGYSVDDPGYSNLE